MTAADPLSPVRRGQPLVITAGAWNDITRATREVLQGKKDDPITRRLAWGGVIEVLALNDTGADLREYKPVAVTGTPYDLPDNSEAWQRRPFFVIDAAAAEDDPLAVTLEAIPDGQVGRVAVGGVVLCDVEISDAGHLFAEFVPSSTDSLSSVESGGVARILAKASGGTPRRCVVQFQTGASGEGGDGGDGLADPAAGITHDGLDLYCQEPDKTVKKRVVDPTTFAYECVTVPACCQTSWWCADNYWLTLTAACCDPHLRTTRILKVTLSNKTGAAADLPDVIFIAHTTGLTWVGRAPLTLTFACVAGPAPGAGTDVDPLGSITGTLSGGFSGGTPTVVPCDFDGPEDFGTWTFSKTVSYGCDDEFTRVETGTVDVSVEPWLDGSGFPENGPYELPPKTSPAPVPAMKGPFVSEVQADECCVPACPCLTESTAFPNGGAITFHLSGFSHISGPTTHSLTANFATAAIAYTGRTTAGGGDYYDTWLAEAVLPITTSSGRVDPQLVAGFYVRRLASTGVCEAGIGVAPRGVPFAGSQDGYKFVVAGAFCVVQRTTFSPVAMSYDGGAYSIFTTVDAIDPCAADYGLPFPTAGHTFAVQVTESTNTSSVCATDCPTTEAGGLAAITANCTPFGGTVAGEVFSFGVEVTTP